MVVTYLRSRARLRTSPRVQFCEPSVAVAALRTGPDQLLADLNYFGYLFEALVVRDLRVFADVDVVDASAGAWRRLAGNAGLPPEYAWSRERGQITDHGTGMQTSAATPL